MASEEIDGMKDKLRELIANVQSCTTKEGVKELEKIYNTRRKTVGNKITPMMDVMVRDAISGKIKEFDDVAKSVTEETLDPSVMEKLNSEREVEIVSLSDALCETYTLYEDCSVAFVTFARMNPPSKAHLKLIDDMVRLSESIGAFAEIYLSKTVDNTRNPLSVDERVSYLKETANRNAIISTNTDINNMFNLLTSLVERNVSRIYFAVGSDRIEEAARAGKYFLQKGGLQFVVVNMGNRLDNMEPMHNVSSTRMRDAVVNNDRALFTELSGVTEDVANTLYEKVQRGLCV